MPKGLQITLFILRTLAIATTGFLVVYTGAHLARHPLILTLLGLLAVAYLVGTIWMMVSSSTNSSFSAALTVVDVLCIASLFCLLLPRGDMPMDSRIPFLAALIVASAVAMVGKTPIAGALGALSGAMILGLVWSLLPHSGASMQGPILAVQIAVIALLAIQVSLISQRVSRRASELKLAQRVASELRAREQGAAHVGRLRERLYGCENVAQIGQCVTDHLTKHFDTKGVGVVLTTENEDFAHWQESARFGTTTIDDRRALVKESAESYGLKIDPTVLECVPVGAPTTFAVGRFRSKFKAPVMVNNRIVGFVKLADSRRESISGVDFAALSHVSSLTGEALARIQRSSEKQNRRTTLLLQEMPEGVLLLGRNGEILLSNPVALRAIQASALARNAGDPPALGDLELAELGRVSEDSEQRFRAWVPRAIAATPAQLNCTASVVMDGRERVGTLVTIVDVTDELAARQRLMDAERTTVVGQTLAGVAHELNNPLAVLMGYADILGREQLPAQIETPIARMREQALRATRIVRNLLNFARRQQTATVAQIGLGKLIEQTMELLRYEARTCNVDVEVNIPETLPPIQGEKYALQQIIVNLVQNALHAMKETRPPKGGHRLHIGVKYDDDRISMKVHDSGPGVSYRNRDSIFEAFFTTKGANEGTGLGLALSRSIAREHGGDLELLQESPLGGATFMLTVPVSATRDHAKDLARATDLTRAFETMPSLDLRILVVDDEAAVRETLDAQLRSMGARVFVASAADEALDCIAQHPFDVVLTDVRMPTGSGLDLHEQIARSHADLAHRVVFMTGDFSNDKLIADIEGRGNRLLEKPFTSEELSSTLRAVAKQSS